MLKKDSNKIPFNKPYISGDEEKYIREVFDSNVFAGKGPFTLKVQNRILEILKAPKSKALFTTSCTDALEMCALLLDIKQGDEVIMPSYTFPSTATAFALRGATIVFVDIVEDNLCINIDCVKEAINKKTKAVVCVHYAGMCTDMHQLKKLCRDNNLALIEDAAHALGSTFKGQALGTFGSFATFSFHESKNIHCGEGGMLVINDQNYFERSEVILEKGTNRTQFHLGKVDKYSWKDLGSSFLGSNLSAAFLYAQLLKLEKVNRKRLYLWSYYNKLLSSISPFIPLRATPNSCHNGHIFAIKLPTNYSAQLFIQEMSLANITCLTHYVPLHLSEGGQRFGYLYGNCQVTDFASQQLVRLPIYYDLDEDSVATIGDKVLELIQSQA